MNKNSFAIQSSFRPCGDQPAAISRLAQGLAENRQYQTLLGVTGARVIIVTGSINILVSRVSGTFIKNKSCIA